MAWWACETTCDGTMLGGYAVVTQDIHTVHVRIGVSFISVEQAWRNPEGEKPDVLHSGRPTERDAPCVQRS